MLLPDLYRSENLFIFGPQREIITRTTTPKDIGVTKLTFETPILCVSTGPTLTAR